MSEVTLTVSEIRGTSAMASYSLLKYTLEQKKGAGYTKVIFPENDPIGGKVLQLELPADAVHIFAPPQLDFNGWTLVIKNENIDQQPIFFWGYWDSEIKKDTYVTVEDIENLDFRNCPNINTGRKLLVLEDKKEWTFRTDSGDNNPFYRQDLLVLNDGLAINKPINSYNTESTAMSYGYYEPNDVPIIVENVTIKRYNNSDKVSFPFVVSGQYDITFRSIAITFIQDSDTISASGDSCFIVNHSAKITFESVTVNRTYSSDTGYGYAFSMNNNFNSVFIDVQAFGKWGVFGTRNMNRVYLENCELNRFDIHCYGKDIKCVRCTFESKSSLTDSLNSSVSYYNQFSSIFGVLYFESCIFKSFCPVLFDSSYHAYSGFELILDHCTLNNMLSDGAIINVGMIESSTNKRMEFSNTNWPNLHIINLEIQGNNTPLTIYLFKLITAPVAPNLNTLGYISQVSVSLIPSNIGVAFSNYSNLVSDKALTSRSTHNDVIISNLPSHL